jgi:hypothetical protein
LDIFRASRDMEPEEIEAIIALDAPAQAMVRGADLNEVIGGAPLHSWIGKTKQQIEKQIRDTGAEDADEQIESVFTALEDAGFGGALDPNSTKAETAARTVTNTNQINPGGGGANEPVFGDEQIPLSELPNDYDSLIKIEGIGDVTANKVLDLKERNGVAVTRKA